MQKQKLISAVKKTVIVKVSKTYRILLLATFALLFLFMLAAMIHIIAMSQIRMWIHWMLLAIPMILFLPCPLYYATWQITFDAEGIQKRFFGQSKSVTHGRR